MPSAIPMPCRHVGCPRMQIPGTGYCEGHQRKPWSNRDTAVVRPERAAVYSTARWKKIRALVIRAHPTCQLCKRNPSRDADHIVPIDDCPDPYDMDNLQALCPKCHARKSQRDGAIRRSGGHS